MKQYFGNLIFVLVLFFLLMVHPTTQTFADYVLSYPSYMPGNRLYALSLALDQLEAFWYWGNVASTKYHLKLTDKYLVEARTLFEYNQYLLAVKALHRSDQQFQLVPQYLAKADLEGKDIHQLKKVVQEAKTKHVEVLKSLDSKLPRKFIWTPEKAKPTELDLARILEESLQIRNSLH